MTQYLELGHGVLRAQDALRRVSCQLRSLLVLHLRKELVEALHHEVLSAGEVAALSQVDSKLQVAQLGGRKGRGSGEDKNEVGVHEGRDEMRVEK